MPPHSLTNLEIQKYYQNEPRFNGVYTRDNLPDKIKDGTYVINLDEYVDIGNHGIALYVNGNAVTYFDSIGVECKHMIHQCADIFVLDLLILCLRVKV